MLLGELTYFNHNNTVGIKHEILLLLEVDKCGLQWDNFAPFKQEDINYKF